MELPAQHTSPCVTKRPRVTSIVNDKIEEEAESSIFHAVHVYRAKKPFYHFESKTDYSRLEAKGSAIAFNSFSS